MGDTEGRNWASKAEEVLTKAKPPRHSSPLEELDSALHMLEDFNSAGRVRAGWIEDHTTYEKSSKGVQLPSRGSCYGSFGPSILIGLSEDSLSQSQLIKFAKQAGIDAHSIRLKSNNAVALNTDMMTQEKMEYFLNLVSNKTKATLEEVAIKSISELFSPAETSDRTKNLQTLSRIIKETPIHETDKQALLSQLNKMTRVLSVPHRD
jgi:hypothetical protein